MQILVGITLWDCEKAEDVAYGQEAQYQKINDLLEPTVITVVNRQMCANEHVLTNESKWTSSCEAEEVIWGFQAWMVFQTEPWDITTAHNQLSHKLFPLQENVFTL
jgi:hypothetical protein